MPASRKRPSRTRMRRAKRESDPLSSDDPASRPTRLDYHQFLATHLGVIEDLLTTLQVYLRDLTASDTLLVRLGTAQNREEQQICTRRLTANVQARTVQLTTLRILVAFLAKRRTDSGEEPPVSIH